MEELHEGTLKDHFGRLPRGEGVHPTDPAGSASFGFLAHHSTATFATRSCRAKSSLVRPQAPGIGSEYRLCTEDPGVTPAVSWQTKALASWTQTQQDAMTSHVYASDGGRWIVQDDWWQR